MSRIRKTQGHKNEVDRVNDWGPLAKKKKDREQNKTLMNTAFKGWTEVVFDNCCDKKESKI